MRERYSIEVDDESVEIYGELTIEETFDFLSFFERKGYNSIILGTENSTLHMLKRNKKEEIIDDRQTKEANERNKNEEVQDEECKKECEESEEEEDYKAMYIEKSEEFLEQRENLIDFREENKKLRSLNKQVFELIKELYNNDQIHPNQREQVRQLLLKTDEYVDGMLGRITSKS